MDEDADTDDELFPRYTDIENLRNYPDVFDEGEEVVATEKIHGTNCRVGIVKGGWMAGSMRLRRKRPLDTDMHLNTYWFPWTLPSVRDMLEKLNSRHRQVVLFGEVYGPGIQKGFAYDSIGGRPGFRAFDLLVDGDYVDHDRFIRICDEFGVAYAPVLYKGPFSLDNIRQVSEGRTTVGDANIREGVVVRPSTERRHPKVGRLVMKYVSDSYLLDKHPDSTDI